MIKFGFNTIAMLTYGLGIRMPWPRQEQPQVLGKVEFKDKPSGIEAEDKTGPTSFEDGSFGFKDENIEFEDK